VLRSQDCRKRLAWPVEAAIHDRAWPVSDAVGCRDGTSRC